MGATAVNDGPHTMEPCRNDVVPAGTWSSWTAGYHYCKKRDCFRRWGKHQTIHAVAVNKSMDAIVSVESSTLAQEDLAGSA